MGDRVRLRRGTGAGKEDVEGLLVPWIGEAELRDIAGWGPALAASGALDRDWDWRAFVEEGRRESAGTVEAYSLLLDGEVQAAMVAEIGARRSRLDGGRLFYVDRLAAAPWNRRGGVEGCRVQGCGQAMMLLARRRSRELGLEGRVGLHALPGAEGFYRRLGMNKLDPAVDDDGFGYFEWPAERVE